MQNSIESVKKISVGLISMNNKALLSNNFQLVKANTKALIIQSDKECFLQDILEHLNEPVELFLSQYEYSFYGEIHCVKKLSRGKIQVEVSYRDSAPHYYRECVCELLN